MRLQADPHDGVDRFDVIGLGALNVDLIVAGAGADDHPVEDSETLTTAEEILARLDAETAEIRPFLGGSAYNAMLMLAQLHTPLRLGLMGISAPAAYGLRESHCDRLRRLHVDDLTNLASGGVRPGLCCALTSVHGRKLRTAPEANVQIVDYLAEEQQRAIAASARVLHLTSLLEDPEVPGSSTVVEAVAAFAEQAKADNPNLVLSFDPGHTWVDPLERLHDLRRIYALADVVFANAQEYAALTRGADTQSSMRTRSLRDLCPSSTVVILKSIDEIVVQHAGGFDLFRVPRLEHAVAVDPTGAGDAVAAGVLAALGDGRSLEEGCQLGLRIAAKRVADFGDRGHVDLRGELGALWPVQSFPTAPGLQPPSLRLVAGESHPPNVLVNVSVVNELQMAAVADDLSRMMTRLGAMDVPVSDDVWEALEGARDAAVHNDRTRLRRWLGQLGTHGVELARTVSAKVVEQMLLQVLRN